MKDEFFRLLYNIKITIANSFIVIGFSLLDDDNPAKDKIADAMFEYFDFEKKKIDEEV